jgi:hypothetical protein
MDPMMSEVLKFGARLGASKLGLPPELLDAFMGKGQFENETGDGPNARRTAALNEVKRKDGSVILWLGARETGKTVGAQRTAEFLGRPTYAVSPEEKLPNWIAPARLEDLDKLPSNITLILDDIPAYMGNRDYNSRLIQSIEKIIPMVRHKRKWHLIFNTQASSQSDKAILMCDMAFCKPLGILMEDAERPNIRRIYKTYVNPYFDMKSQDFVRKHAFMLSNTYRGGISIAKPPNTIKKELVLIAERNPQGTYEVVDAEVEDVEEK